MKVLSVLIAEPDYPDAFTPADRAAFIEAVKTVGYDVEVSADGQQMHIIDPTMKAHQ